MVRRELLSRPRNAYAKDGTPVIQVSFVSVHVHLAVQWVTCYLIVIAAAYGASNVFNRLRAALDYEELPKAYFEHVFHQCLEASLCHDHIAIARQLASETKANTYSRAHFIFSTAQIPPDSRFLNSVDKWKLVCEVMHVNAKQLDVKAAVGILDRQALQYLIETQGFEFDFSQLVSCLFCHSFVCVQLEEVGNAEAVQYIIDNKLSDVLNWHLHPALNTARADIREKLVRMSGTRNNTAALSRIVQRFLRRCV